MSHNYSLMAKALLNFLHILLLISQKFDFTSSKPTGFSIKIIPRDSPESPLYPGNLTQSQMLERSARFSKARAQYLEQRILSLENATSSSNDAKMPMVQNDFYYLAITTFGTPPKVVYLLMDTGSGLVWTQCLPCVNCFQQKYPIFDSKASSSYRKLPCSHFLCNGGPQSRFGCVDKQCVYTKFYGSGQRTKGIASVETIQFERANGAIQQIDGIVFGCSNDNLNFGFGDNTPISGIMGLSWAPDSLMTQLVDYTNRRFSYCFAPFNEGRGPTEITFGEAVPALKGRVGSTRFVPPPTQAGRFFFYLDLVDISVGGDKLGFPPKIFELQKTGSGGCIIDSGSPASSLVNRDFPGGRNPYKEVVEAFGKKYDAYNLKRVEGLEGALCYEFRWEFKDFVSLTYHFDGADFVVDGKFTNYINRQQGYFCVALFPNPKFSLLGAIHQQNKRIVYDANLPALQFVNEFCP